MSQLHSLPTLSDLARENARTYPLVTATVDGDVRLSYRELDARVDRLAAVLSSAGVTSGDFVLWLGQNSSRILEALLACSRVGAALCPANWRQSADELLYVLEDLDPRVVIWEQHDDGQAKARDAWNSSAVWIRAGGTKDEYEEALAAAEASAVHTTPNDPAQACLALYTAAFEGRPRAALLSSEAIVTHNMVLALARQIEAGFVYLNSGPLFHVGTMMFCTATFHLGGTNVFMPAFDATEACRLIETERCQSMMIFPPMDEQIVAANADGQFDLSSLRAARGSDAWNAMVTSDDSPWGRALGGYGQTEVSGMLTFSGLGIGGLGGFGRPSPLVQFRIVDEEATELPIGEVGEMVARGPHMMLGYHRLPDATAAKQRDGWHHTGDLGRREADGTITFIGPRLRLIKSAGENIYPAEVEKALTEHPMVTKAAVIGVPDETWGQSVKALVVRVDPALTEQDLISHCAASIASYKKPRHVEFVDDIPMVGFRPDYDELDRRHGGGGYPGG